MRIWKPISSIYIKDYEKIYSKLSKNNYSIFILNNNNEIDTIESFFLWVKNTLPQDPPLSGKVNFDALVDSIWGGIDSQTKEKIVILWFNPTNLMEKNFSKFKVLLECFEEISSMLLKKEFGINQKKFFKLIMIFNEKTKYEIPFFN